jgi:hypothetical protein
MPMRAFSRATTWARSLIIETLTFWPTWCVAYMRSPIQNAPEHRFFCHRPLPDKEKPPNRCDFAQRLHFGVLRVPVPVSVNCPKPPKMWSLDPMIRYLPKARPSIDPLAPVNRPVPPAKMPCSVKLNVRSGFRQNVSPPLPSSKMSWSAVFSDVRTTWACRRSNSVVPAGHATGAVNGARNSNSSCKRNPLSNSHREIISGRLSRCLRH